MCLICIELQKNRMTSFEARRNMIEFEAELSQEHKFELLKEIWKKEDQEGCGTQKEFEELFKWFIDNAD